MIRRVRRQFIWITMTMLTTVLLVPLIALNVITDAMSYNQTRDLLEQIAISEAAVNDDPGQFENTPPNWKPDSSETDTEVTATSTVVQSSTSDTTAETTEQKSDVSSVKNSTPQTPQNGQTQVPQVTAPAITTKNVSRETKTAAATTAPKVTQAVRTTQLTIRTTQRVTTLPRVTTTKAPVTEEPFDPYPPDPYPWYPYDDETEGMAAILPSATPYAGIKVLAAKSTDTETTTTVTTTTTSKSANHNNDTPEPPLRDKKDEVVTIDHFLCYADKQGNLTKLDGTDDYTESDGQTLLDYVVENEKQDGLYGNLQYFRKDMPNGFLVVFSDRSAEHLLMKKILWVSIVVFLLMEGVVLVLTMLLTKRAMRPMQATFERQRQFISDAGHELKTPLTIISANVDILQDEIGKNKWLAYIQSQTERMRILIGDMMNLTKLEMNDPKKDFVSFSLSTAISNAALPFESQAFEQQKELILEIQDGLQYIGNPDQIKQLVGIFIDNAIKYSSDHGEIRVTLQQTRDKKTLKIFNTGRGVTEAEKERIFERFYRSDSSRARKTGGYGLGLSIAKGIADTHKIKIQVESEYDQWICFVLTL